MKLKKFLPVHLGGPRNNIYNVFIHRFLYVKNRQAYLRVLRKNIFNVFIRRFLYAVNRKPLWNFVEEAKPKRILEIGLGDGYNAEKMMELTDDCKYYCFDTLHMVQSIEAYEDMRDKDNVSFFIGDSKKTLPEYVEDLPKMDLIHIDGGHDYETVKNDWEHCKRLMHEETACFFHDYHSMPGVRKVVDGIGDEYYKKIITPPKSPPDFAIITKRH